MLRQHLKQGAVSLLNQDSSFNILATYIRHLQGTQVRDKITNARRLF